MPAKSLQELFVEEVRDMYDAEKRLLKALPKMAKAASSEELQDAFVSHRRETERQVQRLEQVFRSIGEKPRGKKCDGIMGIIEEGNTAMEELEEGPVLDAALIAGAQKAEHYEIASYGTLAYFADVLGNETAKNLLGATLDEEKAADETLTGIATSDVNRDALLGNGVDTNEGTTRGNGRGRGASRGGTKPPARGSSSRTSSARSSSPRAGARKRSSGSSRSR